MKNKRIPGRTIAIVILVCSTISPAWADGGYVSSSRSVAVSSDQRAIIIRKGDEISMVFSTGYTGEGEDFGWIIPTPSPPGAGDVFETGAKGEIAFGELDRFTTPKLVTISYHGCFPSGTGVLTVDGLRPIENVGAGTRVHAFDLAKGTWVLATILQRQTIRYAGDMITVRLGAETIRATGNHPFFVQGGDELFSRPHPRDVPAGEPLMSQWGRWVEARDLREGDLLVAEYGGVLAVTGLSSWQETTDVHCLEVERDHNCAMGRTGILVHNSGKSGAKEAPGLDGTEQVRVYRTVVLEHYEASILAATDSSALMEWLRANEYQVSPSATGIFDAYIGQRWAFVAVKLSPSEKRSYRNEFLPPLTVRYRATVPLGVQSPGELVFPLRISSISSAQTVKITLYVVAESTVSSANLKTTRLPYNPILSGSMSPEGYVEGQIRAAAGPQGRAMIVLWSGEYGIWDAYLYNACSALMSSPFPAGTRTFLTRLEARIDPGAMTEDIVLKLDLVPSAFHVRIERR